MLEICALLRIYRLCCGICIYSTILHGFVWQHLACGVSSVLV